MPALELRKRQPRPAYELGTYFIVYRRRCANSSRERSEESEYDVGVGQVHESIGGMGYVYSM